jgi:nucleoside phosphorylase
MAPADHDPRRAAEADAWSDVTIGIITAINVEGAAMRTLVSHPRQARFDLDPNDYRVGHLESAETSRPHRVVLVTLADDNTRNAAATCTDMLRSFPRIRCVVMVGIAGGVPAPSRPERHIRLGDVVVGVDGIVDYGHIQQGERAEPRRPIGSISMELKRAAQDLQQGQYLGEKIPWHQLFAPAGDYPMAVFARPPETTDRLHHGRRLVPHPDRTLSGHPDDSPKIHFGRIGSADVLLKNATIRDALASRHGVIAFEMETAGVAAAVVNRGLSWFDVRGVVDYCDEYKDDSWHEYGALAAAGCVRAVLARCPPFPVWRMEAAGVRTLLPEWELDRLRALLSQVSAVGGLTAWQAAVGGLIPPPDRPASLAELAGMLADQNAGPDLIPPLVAFAEYVAARAPRRLADELRAWIDLMAHQHLHLADEIAAYRARVERAHAAESPNTESRAPIRPCLLIQIERDGISSESCEVRYWIPAIPPRPPSASWSGCWRVPSARPRRPGGTFATNSGWRSS